MNYIFKGKHIGLPQIGCHLAGGSWDIVKEIINFKTRNGNFAFTSIFGGSVGGGPVSLAATVFRALRMTQNRNDQLLNVRMIDLGWRNDEQLIELFGIEEKFRLLLVDAPNTSLEDGCITRSKFSAAIDQLRMLPVSRTPTAKAAVLMKVCELICQAADGQGKQQCSESSM